MLKREHFDGKTLINQLENLLDDIHRYSNTVNQYVITSTTDLNGTITGVSQAFCDLTGYSENELIGSSHNLMRHPNTPDDVYKDMWTTITSGQSWLGEIRNLSKDGKCYWVNIQIDSIKDKNGQATGYISIQQDITARKYIEQLSVQDELTGAYNRRYYNQILSQEIDRAKRDEKYLCMMMIDADNFKKYNDTYGHQAGDDVLKTIVNSLQNTFKRAGDFVFRLGGEEFAVLFRAQDEMGAVDVANKARTMIYEQNIPHSGNADFGRVTVSAGVMILDPKQFYIPEEIYKYADEALYRAKENGRNRVEIHGDEDDIELF